MKQIFLNLQQSVVSVALTALWTDIQHCRVNKGKHYPRRSMSSEIMIGYIKKFTILVIIPLKENKTSILEKKKKKD